MYVPRSELPKVTFQGKPFYRIELNERTSGGSIAGIVAPEGVQEDGSPDPLVLLSTHLRVPLLEGLRHQGRWSGGAFR